jgi:hypothetical protein
VNSVTGEVGGEGVCGGCLLPADMVGLAARLQRRRRGQGGGRQEGEEAPLPWMDQARVHFLPHLIIRGERANLMEKALNLLRLGSKDYCA